MTRVTAVVKTVPNYKDIAETFGMAEIAGVDNDGVDYRSWVGFSVQQLVNIMLYGVNVVQARTKTCKPMYV